MKRAILFAVFMLVAFSGFSQFDYRFNYQAVVRNGTGALVPNGSTVGLRISILEGSAIGTVLYQETHSATVNNNQGLVNLIIGGGTPAIGGMLFSGNFKDLTQDKYLKIEVDPTGGTSYTDLGATKLQFVPYAAHAFTASYADNGTQWQNGTASAINYSAGNVNIGTSSLWGNSALNVEKSTSTEPVLTVTQSGSSSTGVSSALLVLNSSTSNSTSAITGSHLNGGYGVRGHVSSGTGVGVEGRSFGTSGIGVVGTGNKGVSARTTATNGIAIELDGFMKVIGTKTAFQTSALVLAASNITLSYGGASSTDMIFVTPINTSTTMPSWSLIWSSTASAWQLWCASDDGIPSNFPAGTSFNVLIIKQ